jgi:selenocysteine-specific elongation factor
MPPIYVTDARPTAAQPLTLGTAGHVDHGKTALVKALTGIDTDRLPEEKERGLTIALGFAPLVLPGGRRISLVDVPGHERFVRAMVSGASGIDMYLMVIASDDGVMPQTREHAEVMCALGIERGVVAVTKADLADPARASREAAELLPGAQVVACSARTGAGTDALLDALERVSGRLPSRARDPSPPRLHVDRAFTIRGRGTVLTGTLWSGTVGVGDELELQPSRTRVRVRGVHVHDTPVGEAAAGQRVAVNVTGTKAVAVQRGEVLCAAGTCAPTRVLDCSLRLSGARHGQRVQVHHGTRAVPGRLAHLDGADLWQLRLEQPLMARDGDRLVVRRLAPPDTLGGGVVLDVGARRHGARADVLERLSLLSAGEAPTPLAPDRPGGGADSPPAAPPSFDPQELDALEARLRDAGAALLSEAQLGAPPGALAALRSRGRAVRVSGRLYAHPEILRDVRTAVVALIEREGVVTLARVRDALGISRKSAQAFLEHLDGARVTRREPDDRRVPGALLARSRDPGPA